MMLKDILWTELYRPHKVADCILPARTKATFQSFIDNGEIPNLLLTGSTGVGKTTIARAMLEEIGADFIVINASLSGNIDTLRNHMQDYCSSVSLAGGRKYLVLDEADYLTAAAQPALRTFIEDFASNVSFILTANYPGRIIQPLHSRCAVIDFTIPRAEAAKLSAAFFKRARVILEAQGVPYDPKVLAEIISKFYPDWRRVLNQLQTYAAQSGKIDSGVLASMVTDVSGLVGHIKTKDFTAARKWLAEHDSDSATIFRALYDGAAEWFTVQGIAALVLLIGKYQFQAASVADPEINLAAFVLECMVDVECK